MQIKAIKQHKDMGKELRDSLDDMEVGDIITYENEGRIVFYTFIKLPNGWVCTQQMSAGGMTSVFIPVVQKRGRVKGKDYENSYANTTKNGKNVNKSENSKEPEFIPEDDEIDGEREVFEE